MDPFVPPTHRLKTLLLQRTSLQLKSRWLLSNFARRYYEKYFLSLEATLRRREIAKRFTEEIQEDYHQFPSYLPDRIKSVADIGVGLGAINILLNRRYADYEPKFYLLDKNILDKNIYYFYEETASA